MSRANADVESKRLAIPTVVDGGNHTTAFAQSATTIEAHNACLDVSKALAGTAIRVLTDDKFFAEVGRFISNFATELSSLDLDAGSTNIQRRRSAA